MTDACHDVRTDRRPLHLSSRPPRWCRPPPSPNSTIPMASPHHHTLVLCVARAACVAGPRWGPQSHEASVAALLRGLDCVQETGERSCQGRKGRHRVRGICVLSFPTKCAVLERGKCTAQHWLSALSQLQCFGFGWNGMYALPQPVPTVCAAGAGLLATRSMSGPPPPPSTPCSSTCALPWGSSLEPPCEQTRSLCVHRPF